MLSDRNYDRFGTGTRKISPVPSWLTIILIVNVVVFIFQMFTEYKVTTYDGVFESDRITENFALVSADVSAGQVYRLVTYMFIHGGFWHLAFNMWGLFMFGSLLEGRIGPGNFLKLYLISGLIGAICWVLFNWNSQIPCVGASGAVFGIIVATALFFPDLPIMLLFPPIPMKLKTFAIVYIIAEMLMETGKWDRMNIAHIVHLGGALGGYLFIKILYGNEIPGIMSLFRSGKSRRATIPFPRHHVANEGTEDVSQKEVDRLLDKISVEGINSLSETEMETLRKAREQMKPQGR